MKKSFLMLGLAVAAMSSCTNDEVIDMNQSNQKAIGFESFVNKGTRAADDDYVPVTNEVNKGNLNRFYVYGYHNGTQDNIVFDDVLVVKDATVGWKMAEANEKDWKTQIYNFAAIADGAGAGVTLTTNPEQKAYSSSFANATLNITDYKVNESPSNQTDLIAAVATRNNSTTLNTNAVSLDFKHLLSKVDFKFTNTNLNNLSMVVSNVALKVKTQADCAYNGTATWSNWDTEITYELTQPTNNTRNTQLFSENNALKNTAKKYIIAKGESSIISAEYFVIPDQTEASINYTVTFYDADGNQVEQKSNQTLSLFPNELTSWQPSYIYKYNVQLPASPKKIEFTVGTVGGWKSEDVYLDGKLATTAN